MDIQFRGKTKGGEYKYGYYFYSPQRQRHIILTSKDGLDILNEVEADSIAQYTGFTDLQGNKIYDKDSVLYYGDAPDSEICKIAWTNESSGDKWGWGIVSSNGQEKSFYYGTTEEDFNRCLIL